MDDLLKKPKSILHLTASSIEPGFTLAAPRMRNLAFLRAAALASASTFPSLRYVSVRWTTSSQTKPA
jgi:hypothetical protein